jgi:hypothetical protein
MKRLPIIFVFAVTSFAQQLSITGPAGAIHAGSAATLSVSLTGSAGLSIAGLQWTIANPGGAVTCAAGAASTAASKTVACQTNGTTTTFVVYGINSTTLSDGVVASIAVALPISTQSGTTSELIATPLAANLSGEFQTITAGAAFSLATVSACNVTGDATTSTADIAAELTDILIGSGGVDLNGDGAVNILDLIRIVTAEQGGTCKTGP